MRLLFGFILLLTGTALAGEPAPRDLSLSEFVALGQSERLQRVLPAEVPIRAVVRMGRKLGVTAYLVESANGKRTVALVRVSYRSDPNYPERVIPVAEVVDVRPAGDRPANR